MSWKIVFVGGVVYYATMFILSFGTGYLIHSPDGVLGEVYKTTASFWRPELNMDPPDMMAMMKIWVPIGLISSFLAAGVYSVIRSSLSGAAWKRGLKFGVIASIFALIAALGYWSIFNLPDQVWKWWMVESVFLNLVGGIALGAVAQKLAPAGK